MTDRLVEEATGIRASTFHRWQRGEVAPTVDKVRQFCAGLGVSSTEALAALGVGPREATQPEPAAMDPLIRQILRHLADPDTNEETKAFIRDALRSLVTLAEARPKRRRRKAS